MTDPHNLARFVTAQAASYPAALAELRAGAKRTHWMWFVFPQLAGLGHSALAQHYALRSLAEAQAYLAHPVLGARLSESIAVLLALPTTDAASVFGQLDALKLRSSLTLFAAAGGGAALTGLLIRWFGDGDPRTLALLA